MILGCKMKYDIPIKMKPSTHKPLFLIFDCESSGYSKYRPRHIEAGFNIEDIKWQYRDWVRMVQIAWAIHDAQGKCLHYNDYIVKPSGFKITDVHYNVHGINTALAENQGIPAKEVLQVFSEDVKKVDYVVAHYGGFDIGLVTSECHHAGIDHPFTPGENNCKFLDTKSHQLGYLNRNRARNRQQQQNYLFNNAGYERKRTQWGNKKGPGLLRLHRILFGEDVPDQHNATRDVVATARCFFEMLRRGMYTIHDPEFPAEKHNKLVEDLNRIHKGKVQSTHRPHVNLRSMSEAYEL